MARDFPTDRAKRKAEKWGENIPREALLGVGALAAIGIIGSGDDQVPNEGPTAVANVSTDSSNHYAYLDGSQSQDPDGSIESYEWTPLLNGAPVAPVKQGKQVTYTVGEDLSFGTWGIRLTVTDEDGNEDTATIDGAFTLDNPNDSGGNGGGYENSITLSTVDRPSFITYPSVFWEIETSGNLESSQGHSGLGAQGELYDNESVTIEYNGSIDSFEWSGAPIAIEQDGARVDPYSIGDGPRFRSDRGDKMLEVTIRQSARLYLAHGFEPAQNVAEWLAGALDEHNVGYDILYDLPLVNMVTERVACHNPFRGDTVCPDGTSCNDFSCCDEDRAMPGALYWWANYASDNSQYEDLTSDWNSATGNNTRVGGDVVTLRKDSNCLLTKRLSGGCGQVGGMFCVAGGERAYDAPHGFIPGWSTTLAWGDGIHDAIHEIGHNFGFSHPGPHDCSKGGGEGWVDSDGRWNRTPCVPWNGCTNRCGVDIPDRDGATSDTVVRHLYFTECTVDHFMSETGGEQGQVEATARAGMHRNRRSRAGRESDCDANCFDKDLDRVPGLGQQASARSHGGDCDCGCGGCSGGCEGCGSQATRAPQTRRELLQGGKTY